MVRSTAMLSAMAAVLVSTSSPPCYADQQSIPRRKRSNLTAIFPSLQSHSHCEGYLRQPGGAGRYPAISSSARLRGIRRRTTGSNLGRENSVVDVTLTPALRIARSTFYDRPNTGTDDATIVAQMKSICDEFETYGYRRVDAELRHRGLVVNAKKVRRLMREHALNPKPRRRFIATTDSDHNDPICPNLATTMTLDGPNQLWVADITYVAITTSFVYVAVTLDAWSRRVVGYAIRRSIDARLAAAALKAAISARNPPRGCVHHFRPRGIGNICGNRFPRDQDFDAYRGLNFLVRQPFVDAKRVVVISFSQGGLTCPACLLNVAQLNRPTRTSFERRSPSILFATG